MRMRNLLAATTVSALALGAVGIPAYSVTAPPPAKAGTVVTWGDPDDVTEGAAVPVPGDLTGLVKSVAADQAATGVVTLDGGIRVWGATGASEVTEAPTGVTDATALALNSGHGMALHADGHVSTWGPGDALDDVPSDLRAKAIAVQSYHGFAVRTDGTLESWGGPSFDLPTTGLTDLVDVSSSLTQALALHGDGTVVTWGYLAQTVPDFGGKKVTQIATSMGYSGVVLDDGTIDIWGDFGIPAGEPIFDGLTPAGKVVSLSLGGSSAAAVTADGAVHAWGTGPVTTVPASLTGQPVSAIALGGYTHAAVVVTAFRDVTTPTITGQPEVGRALTAAPATFSLTPDAPATGQWYADSDPIAGKTASTLVLDTSLVGKSISYRTTATRGTDTVVSTSTPAGPVSLATSTTTLSVSPASAVVGSTQTVTATVAASSAPSGTVTFTVGSTTATATLSGGKATSSLPALAAGSHSVTAAYSGDSGTKPSSSAASTATVTKASSNVSGAAKAKGITEKVAKKVKITLTVTSVNGVSPAGEVTVTLKGATDKTVTVTVNAQGTATVTIKKVKRGKYTAKLSYAGNGNVLASSGKVKFKV